MARQIWVTTRAAKRAIPAIAVAMAEEVVTVALAAVRPKASTCVRLTGDFGIVGSIAATGTLALICSVVVVPVCSIALGALGYRWFGKAPAQPAPAGSDLSRSVVYVDKKLTLALNSLGSERHQQALIALFQAKTAIELALGTEQDDADRDNAPVQVDAYRLRPRIQDGSSAKAAMPESNSLAAS